MMRWSRLPLAGLLLAGSLLFSTGCSATAGDLGSSQTESLAVQYTGQVTAVEGTTVTLALVELSKEKEDRPVGQRPDREKDESSAASGNSSAAENTDDPSSAPARGSGHTRGERPDVLPEGEETPPARGQSQGRPGSGGPGGAPMGNGIQLTGETVTLTLTEATTYDLGPQEEQQSTLAEGDWVQLEAKDGTVLAVSSLWERLGRPGDGQGPVDQDESTPPDDAAVQGSDASDGTDT